MNVTTQNGNDFDSLVARNLRAQIVTRINFGYFMQYILHEYARTRKAQLIADPLHAIALRNVTQSLRATDFAETGDSLSYTYAELAQHVADIIDDELRDLTTNNPCK